MRILAVAFKLTDSSVNLQTSAEELELLSPDVLFTICKEL
jgi:hypothetical protein